MFKKDKRMTVVPKVSRAPRPKMSELYSHLRTIDRVLIALLSSGLFFAIMYTQKTEYTWRVTLVWVILLVTTHIMLTRPVFVKTGISFLVGVFFIFNSATLAGLYEDYPNNLTTIISWVVIQLSTSILVIIIAHTTKRRPVWLINLIAVVAMSVIALAYGVVTQNNGSAISLGVASALIILLLSFVRFRKRQTIPEFVEIEDYSRLSKELNKSFVTSVVETPAGTAIIGTDKKGHLFISYVVKLDSRNSLKVGRKGEITYNGKPIAGWISAMVENSNDFLPNKVPYMQFITVQNTGIFNNEEGYKSISLFNKQTNDTQFIVLIHENNARKATAEAIDNLPYARLSNKQLRAVKDKVSSSRD